MPDDISERSSGAEYGGGGQPVGAEDTESGLGAVGMSEGADERGPVGARETEHAVSRPVGMEDASAAGEMIARPDAPPADTSAQSDIVGETEENPQYETFGRDPLPATKP